MKALTDKIVDRLTELSNVVPGSEYCKGMFQAALVVEQYERDADFNEVARVMMKHLAEKYHPHHRAIIDSTNAELLEGKQSTGQVLDYIPD
jgi:hypothetical protein